MILIPAFARISITCCFVNPFATRVVKGEAIHLSVEVSHISRVVFKTPSKTSPSSEPCSIIVIIESGERGVEKVNSPFSFEGLEYCSPSSGTPLPFLSSKNTAPSI